MAISADDRPLRNKQQVVEVVEQFDETDGCESGGQPDDQADQRERGEAMHGLPQRDSGVLLAIRLRCILRGAVGGTGQVGFRHSRCDRSVRPVP
jgi:hypothetical protein